MRGYDIADTVVRQQFKVGDRIMNRLNVPRYNYSAITFRLYNRHNL